MQKSTRKDNKTDIHNTQTTGKLVHAKIRKNETNTIYPQTRNNTHRPESLAYNCNTNKTSRIAMVHQSIKAIHQTTANLP